MLIRDRIVELRRVPASQLRPNETALMLENWLAIPSLGNRYEVSDLGNVRRLVASRGTRAGRVLAPQTMPSGYLIVSVQLDGKTAGRLVHRLVCEAFIGSCPDGQEVNHKDSDKANNRLENLEYVTRSANIQHAVENAGCYRGERNSQAIINPEIVREIRRLHADGMGYKLLAKHFKLTWGLVRDVATRRNWAHVE